jgi:hypothetical protein
MMIVEPIPAVAAFKAPLSGRWLASNASWCAAGAMHGNARNPWFAECTAQAAAARFGFEIATELAGKVDCDAGTYSLLLD